jgi:hypothetical protein
MDKEFSPQRRRERRESQLKTPQRRGQKFKTNVIVSEKYIGAILAFIHYSFFIL